MRRIEYVKAQELIRNPRKWNQGYYTVDCFGMQCLPFDANAIRWDALSACNKFAHPNDHSRKELIKAAHELGFLSIFNLNETGTHEDVMKMFDMAIRFCDNVSIVKPGVLHDWYSYTPLSEDRA